MEFANRLKALRKNRKMGISDCASQIGVSQSTYRDWEQGRSIRGEPYLEIAKVLGVSLSELFGLKPKDLVYELNEIETELERVREHVKNIKSIL